MSTANHNVHVLLCCEVEETTRVQQLRGLFDLPEEKTSIFNLSACLPLAGRPWNIGLITGPSGSGKSSLARHLFHRLAAHRGLWESDLPAWPTGKAIIDGFADKIGIKDATALLSSVGFSSPPAWLRPYHVLSTGQRFRADLARLLSEGESGGAPLVYDEYTSVVDRTVAKVCSAALARTVRARKLQFVAVTCHEDVLDWLQPDWHYSPEAGFRWRSLQPRPRIRLEVTRTTAAAWPLFAPHHYLSASCCKGSTCFLALWKNRPVAFSSWMAIVDPRVRGRREHRTVVLPDFQGVGIGHALSSLIASMWVGLGVGEARSVTTHPAFAAARARSPDWELVRPPSVTGRNFAFTQKAHYRMTSGWRYVGAPLPLAQARRLHGG